MQNYILIQSFISNPVITIKLKKMFHENQNDLQRFYKIKLNLSVLVFVFRRSVPGQPGQKAWKI